MQDAQHPYLEQNTLKQHPHVRAYVRFRNSETSRRGLLVRIGTMTYGEYQIECACFMLEFRPGHVWTLNLWQGFLNFY